jgi:hypothetical protein
VVKKKKKPMRRALIEEIGQIIERSIEKKDYETRRYYFRHYINNSSNPTVEQDMMMDKWERTIPILNMMMEIWNKK